MPLIDFALQYAARGWSIFPLKPRSKIPLIGKAAGGRGFHDATTDPRQIEAWWRACPDANIGLATGASGLVVLDADGPEGLAQLREAAGGTLARTLVQRTGREGGFHFFYSGTGVKSSQVKGEHLDVRGSTGYVVAPPSVHPSGAVYAWVDATEPVAAVPDWVRSWVANRKGGAPRNAASTPRSNSLAMSRANPERRPSRNLAARSIANQLQGPPYSESEANRLRSALSVIDAAIDGATWFSYGAALHDLKWIVSGVDQGFEIWDEWSSTSSGDPLVAGEGGYRGRADLEKRWAGFDREYNGVRCTVATIFRAAMDLGWSYEVKTENLNGHKPEGLFPENFNQAKTETNPLIELNEKYATIGDLGGKCLVMSWVPSKADPEVRVPSFQTFKAFHDRYAHRYVQVEDKMRQIGAYWTCWAHRKSYDGLDLVPGAPAILPGNILNLWTGFAIQEAPGDWSLMRQHIAHVLAAGDRPSAEYIMRFAAWTVQHPGERAEVALVFRGGKGSGKGTFANALRRIFGAHGLQVYNSKHLVGAFNGHLRACLLLFADEAFWAGDKQGESVLKGMLTERALMIEQKGIDATPWRNRLHVLMAANADWVIPASHDERRYAAFDVSGDRVGDQAYFKALHQQMHAGGLEAMLHDLLRFDLGDWHPRQVLQTKGLQHQKEMSLGTLAGWWENILQNGAIPGAFDDKGIASASDLLEALTEHSRNAREANGTALGRFLRGVGGERLHTKTGNFWRFPPILNAREDWERKMGGWPWQLKIDVWRPSDPRKR